VLTRKKTVQIGKGNDSIFCGWIEKNPITNMIFRPEEVHGTSGETYVVVPFIERNGHISYDTLRINIQYLTISHLHTNRLAAVHANRIDLNCFPRKKPANCQRLEGSLAKPLLFTFHSDGILVGQVVKGGQRNDEICFWKNPTWKDLCKKGLNGFSAVLYGDPKCLSYFSEKWGFPGFDKTFHNAVVGFV